VSQFNRDNKPASHLIHLIKSTRNHHPNFVLFLGAGASVESGVKTAGQMISEWRAQYRQIHPDSTSRGLNKQPWYDKSEEYSRLFEHLYDQPSQRREYIENCLENASPSWGYIYLVQLIKQKVFNTVFTTNFDDLLNEACYNYSNDIRPLVCAHDSSIRSVRITTKRPKIIKLHGDFLYDSIKNTVRELESLEANMRDKLKQYSNEFGMIVIGYSGNDRSVTDTLDALLRNDDTFPHGIYWCIRKGSQIPTSIDHFSRFPRFHIVEIDGFNAFFAELYASMNSEPHPFFTNPYSVAANNLAALIQGLGTHTNKKAIKETISPQLKRDVSLLGQSISKPPDFQKTTFEGPFDLLASNDIQQQKYDSAASHVQSALGQGVTDTRIKLAFQILKEAWNEILVKELISAIEKTDSNHSFGLSTINELLSGFLSLDRVDAATQLANLPGLQQRAIAKGGGENELLCLLRAETEIRINGEMSPLMRQQVRVIADTSKSALNKCVAKTQLNEHEELLVIIKELSKEGRLENIAVVDFPQMPFAKGLPSEYVNKIKEFGLSSVSSLSEIRRVMADMIHGEMSVNARMELLKQSLADTVLFTLDGRTPKND
jgi:NAD-dependent SIR2 family protein deacetylase